MTSLDCDLVDTYYPNFFPFIPVHFSRDPAVEYASNSLISELQFSRYICNSGVNQHFE